MFKNVIVGVDGGEGGRDAIALAKTLLGEGGKLTFAHVPHQAARMSPETGAAYAAAERERAREPLEKAREEAALEAQLSWRGAPSVGRGLHELAVALGADLLVIGSSRRGLLGRVLIGDDTRAALNGSPCAVAVAPAGYAQQPQLMREIGLGYNASPESERALEVARAIAAEHHSKLSAFEAVSIPTYAFMGPVAADEGTIEEMVDAARERVARLRDVEPHAAYGQPAEELALYSASLDMLVVGSRDYGPLGRLVHGSTSRQLARSARCPLLVLARAARATTPPTTAQNNREAATAART